MTREDVADAVAWLIDHPAEGTVNRFTDVTAKDGFVSFKAEGQWYLMWVTLDSRRQENELVVLRARVAELEAERDQ